MERYYDDTEHLSGSKSWHSSNQLHGEVLRALDGNLSIEFIYIIVELVQSSGEVANRIATAYVTEDSEDAADFLNEAEAKLARFEENLLMAVDLGLISQHEKTQIYRAFNDTKNLINQEKATKSYIKRPKLKLV